MKFIANKIHWIGLLLLAGFAAAAAGLYFDVPARLQNNAANKPTASECGMASQTAENGHAGCGAAMESEGHGCCGESKLPALTLPPGHPPIEGYTVQSDAHAGCNHHEGGATATADAK